MSSTILKSSTEWKRQRPSGEAEPPSSKCCASLKACWTTSETSYIETSPRRANPTSEKKTYEVPPVGDRNVCIPRMRR
jgi:hypothetical protein